MSEATEPVDAPVQSFDEILRFKIDGYEQIGPVQVSVVTIPPRGDTPVQVMNGEIVGSSSYTKTLDKGAKFPLRIRAWRYRIPIARHISKETRKVVDIEDRDTWPSIAKLFGVVHTQTFDPSVSRHVELCQHTPRCPRELELGDGILSDGRSVWVLREDGPPVREETLEQVRIREEADRHVKSDVSAAGKPAAVQLGPKAAPPKDPEAIAIEPPPPGMG